MRERLTKRMSVVAVASLCVLAAVAGGASAAGAGTQVYAWGYNAGGGFGDCTANGVPNALCGQAGVADVQVVTTPTALAAIPNATAIGSGMFHSLAVRADGSVWAWGMNGSGQLGSGGGSGAFSVQPVQVPGITSAVAVAGGWHQSHAIRADGTLWSWGSAFTGLGSYSSFAPPTQVPGLSGVASVAAGESASYAVLSDGTLWSWGFNGSGQLGTGSFDSSSSPVQVTGLQDVTAVATHFVHALAVKRDGTVWAWGGGRRTPVQVAGLDHVVAVAAGAFVSFALRDDGTVWTWGDDLGGGPAHTSPVPVVGLSNVDAIAAGGFHLLARTTDGSLWGWGGNGGGQLGLGTQTPVESVPTLISAPNTAGMIAAGRAHSLATEAVAPDRTPPVITTPSDVEVDATSPAGAVVDYTVTSQDAVDGTVLATCAPQAGAFAIGTTTVACTATDAAGNSASASFEVHVKGAAEQLAVLAVAATEIGPGTSFADKLAAARAALAGGNRDDACEILYALASQVGAQRGKSVTEQQAVELLTIVARIRTVLAC